MKKIAAFVIHLNKQQLTLMFLLHSWQTIDLALHYLLSSTRLALQDGFCGFIVFVRHGTGKRGHSLAVTNSETNIWMGNEQLYNHVVLAADGSVDGSSTLCILRKITIATIYSVCFLFSNIQIDISSYTLTDLCIYIGSKLQKALHHLLQPPAACQVERRLSISGFFISFTIWSRSPGTVHITTTRNTEIQTACQGLTATIPHEQCKLIEMF